MTWYVVRDDEGPWLTESPPLANDQLVLATEDQAAAEATLHRECCCDRPERTNVEPD